MKDNISKIDIRISQLKQKKEKIKTQAALLLFKEAQIILGDKFSDDLVLNILLNSWKEASDKQKEEWINSAPSFREVSSKGKSKKVPIYPRTHYQNPAEDSQGGEIQKVENE